MEVGERPALSSGLQGSLPLPADAAIVLLHIEVKMVLVRVIGSGSQHSAKNATGVLVRLYHELGFLLCDGNDVDQGD